MPALYFHPGFIAYFPGSKNGARQCENTFLFKHETAFYVTKRQEGKWASFAFLLQVHLIFSRE